MTSEPINLRSNNAKFGKFNKKTRKIPKLISNFLTEDKDAFLVYIATEPTIAVEQTLTKIGVKGIISKPFSASSFDRYIQYFFKEKYKKSWNEVQAFSDKGERKL